MWHVKCCCLFVKCVDEKIYSNIEVLWRHEFTIQQPNEIFFGTITIYSGFIDASILITFKAFQFLHVHESPVFETNEEKFEIAYFPRSRYFSAKHRIVYKKAVCMLSMYQTQNVQCATLDFQ